MCDRLVKGKLLLINQESSGNQQINFCEYDVFLLVTQAYSDKVKKIRVLPTGVEPVTFRLVLRMLYH